ncbi:MAG: hypothetical protein M0C28_24495 [Candidatus Moduliflexus flocculans]|nr:hypothetical protein [Candidatus Moduliflexus flocculans]
MRPGLHARPGPRQDLSEVNAGGKGSAAEAEYAFIFEELSPYRKFEGMEMLK